MSFTYSDCRQKVAFGDILTIDRASVKNVFNRNGVLEEVPINTHAYAYDPITGAPLGISIEEARTNLLTYSEQFDNAAWSKANATVTPNATTAPDGTLTADRLQINAGAINRLEVSLGALVGDHTASIWVKGNGANTFRFWAGFSSRSNQDISGEWTRIDLTADDAVKGLRITNDLSGNPVDIYIWAAQVEAGSVATSHIKTEASTATRAADVVTIDSLVPWFNPSEFTMVFDVQADGFGDVNKWITTIYDAARANEISLLVNTSNQLRLTTENGGTADGAIQYDQNSVDGRLRIAISVTQSRIAMSSNGSVAASDTIIGFSAVQTLMTLGSAPPLFSSNLGGTMSLVKAYPEALTDAQLQAESAL